MFKKECIEAISLATVPEGAQQASWDLGAALGGRPTGITITKITPGESGGLGFAAAEILKQALLRSLADIPDNTPLSEANFKAIETAVRGFYAQVGDSYTIVALRDRNAQECDAVISKLQALVEAERQGPGRSGQ